MNNRAFHFEIKDMMTQFVSAFDDIVIGRFNKDRVEQDRIKVRYVYSPKQRVLHDIINKGGHTKLPAVAVSINSVYRDDTRVFNKNSGSFHLGQTYDESLDANLATIDHIPTPVPVNIDVSMSIITKYQTDMDQISSNFIPYTNPYIVISWKVPEAFVTIDQEIRSEVLWGGTINMTYPTELTGSKHYRVAGDTGFTIKGWLFKSRIPAEGIIYNIDTKFTPVTLDDDLGDDPVTKPLSTHPNGV